VFRAIGARELSPPRRMERSGTLGIGINISAALKEGKKRDPRQQKIVVQSGWTRQLIPIPTESEDSVAPSERGNLLYSPRVPLRSIRRAD